MRPSDQRWSVRVGSPALAPDGLQASSNSVESTPDGLVMLEPGGQIAFMNPTAMELLGLTREQLPAEPFAVSALPAVAGERLGQCLETVRDREGVQEFEFQEPERCVLQLRRVDLKSATGRSYGQLVHLHDIFLPAEYPKRWVVDGRFWDEQYLLQAFLAFNDSFEVLWGGHWMHLTHPDALRAAFATYDPRHAAPGSFWMRRTK